MAFDEEVQVQPAVVLTTLNVEISQRGSLEQRDALVEEYDFVFCADLVHGHFNAAIQFEFHNFRQVSDCQILRHMEAIIQILKLALIVDHLEVDGLDDHCEQGRMLEPVVLVFDLALNECVKFFVVVDTLANIRVLPLRVAILHAQHGVLQLNELVGAVHVCRVEELIRGALIGIAKAAQRFLIHVWMTDEHAARCRLLRLALLKHSRRNASGRSALDCIQVGRVQLIQITLTVVDRLVHVIHLLCGAVSILAQLIDRLNRHVTYARGILTVAWSLHVRIVDDGAILLGINLDRVLVGLDIVFRSLLTLSVHAYIGHDNLTRRDRSIGFSCHGSLIT